MSMLYCMFSLNWETFIFIKFDVSIVLISFTYFYKNIVFLAFFVSFYVTMKIFLPFILPTNNPYAKHSFRSYYFSLRIYVRSFPSLALFSNSPHRISNCVQSSSCNCIHTFYTLVTLKFAFVAQIIYSEPQTQKYNC